MDGTIKRLVLDKGFGFVRDMNGTEYFFHRSTVQGTPFDMLHEGQAVRFEEERVGAQKGPRAKNVEVAV